VSRAEDAIFTRRRLSLCGYAFLASYVIAFAIRLLAGKWMIDKAGHPTYIDFLQWWVGGQFALIQNAAGAYNYSTFSAAQTLVTKSAPPIIYFPWVYPPTMLIVVAPIARLPYQAAFFAWIGATLCFVRGRPLRDLARVIDNCSGTSAAAGCE
jgi:alpha-1,2-mannosyltransferase